MNPLLQTATKILGLVFLLAAYPKLQDQEAFALAVANYQILPDSLVHIASQTLIYVELLCGLCLIFDILTRGAALLISLLLCIFLSAMLYNLARGLDVSCGCFNTLSENQPVFWLSLARDILLLLTAFFVFKHRVK